MRRRWFVLCLVSSAIWILAACGGETPTPRVPPPTATPRVPTATPTPLPSPTPADFFVSILNRRLTRAQVVDEIRREETVTVAGWNYTAREALVEQFKAWVEREYGVEVTLQYIAEPSPQTYLDNVYAAQQSNSPPPYDVIAVEENYFLDAQSKGAAETILPSDLLRNVERIETAFLHESYAIPFQASATVGPIFHNDAVGEWFRDWTDLADARVNRRFTLPRAEGIPAGAFLVGMAGALGKDYKNPDRMRDTIAYVCSQIVPNALRVTNDFSEMQELLREDRIDVAVAWNMLARLEGLSGADGTQDITFRAMESGQPAINGYAWIPKGTAHPVLAQLWIQWRLSDGGQLPTDAWGISNVVWGEYQEGLLGASYEAAIPEWLKPDYFRMYPSVGATRDLYKQVDWAYYNEHAEEWMAEYRQCTQ